MQMRCQLTLCLSKKILTPEFLFYVDPKKNISFKSATAFIQLSFQYLQFLGKLNFSNLICPPLEKRKVEMKKIINYPTHDSNIRMLTYSQV